MPELKIPQVDLPPGWQRPIPDHLPRATYWPSVLAFGVMLFVWGVVTTWVMTLAGVLLSAVALRGWIREMEHADD